MAASAFRPASNRAFTRRSYRPAHAGPCSRCSSSRFSCCPRQPHRLRHADGSSSSVPSATRRTSSPSALMDRAACVSTRTPGYESEPSWGPNGRRIVAAGGPGLVELTPGGRLVRGLRLPGSLIQPRWSPDGRRIAYLALRCEAVSVDPACADLWVVRPDGTVHRRLSLEGVDTTQNYGWLYSWAPGGQRIVFVSQKGLVVVDVDTGAKRLLALTRGVLAQDPSWSPDGRWIAFTRQRKAFSGSDLYAVSPDGRRAARDRPGAGRRAAGVVARRPDGRLPRRLAVRRHEPQRRLRRPRRRVGPPPDRHLRRFRQARLVARLAASSPGRTSTSGSSSLRPTEAGRQVQIARGANPDWR